MKNYAEVIQGQFVDYAGNTHHITVAAISNNFKTGECPSVVNIDGMHTETLGAVLKGVKIGISICNPTDEYNEKAGVLKAIARAEQADYVLLSTTRGHINREVVKALLTSEITYIKNNPEQYIPGYAEMKGRYEKNQEMQAIHANFTETERIVMEKLEENPQFLDNVNKYLTWKANQEKGKGCPKEKK